MIAVVASALDDEATALVARWRRHGAVLLTPLDLAVDGWRVGQACPGEIAGDMFVAEGVRRRAADLTGVLVRLPAVPARELVGVVAEDREYAASEGTALLSWWLGGLRCPVVNRPSPTCLVGPGRSRYEWLARAAALGLAVRPATVAGSAVPAPVGPAGTGGDLVTVLNGQCGTGTGPQRAAAWALADESGAAMLGVWFDRGRPQVCGVTLVPPLDADMIGALEGVLA